MNKYRVRVWRNDPFDGVICSESLMTRDEKNETCMLAEERIHKMFKWEHQDKRYMHVLSWCELENGVFDVYMDGKLYTDEDFETCVADRPGVRFVRAWHRI